MRPPFLPGTIPIVCPLRITRVAAPSGALHRYGHAEECTHVSDGTVQFLKVHIETAGSWDSVAAAMTAILASFRFPD